MVSLLYMGNNTPAASVWTGKLETKLVEAIPFPYFCATPGNQIGWTALAPTLVAPTPTNREQIQ